MLCWLRDMPYTFHPSVFRASPGQAVDVGPSESGRPKDVELALGHYKEWQDGVKVLLAELPDGCLAELAAGFLWVCDRVAVGGPGQGNRCLTKRDTPPGLGLRRQPGTATPSAELLTPTKDRKTAEDRSPKSDEVQLGESSAAAGVWAMRYELYVWVALVPHFRKKMKELLKAPGAAGAVCSSGSSLAKLLLAPCRLILQLLPARPVSSSSCGAGGSVGVLASSARPLEYSAAVLWSECMDDLVPVACR